MQLLRFLKEYTDQKNICFKSGAFVFEDPNNNLFHKIQQVSKSYKRISSHEKHFKSNDEVIVAYGLDIPDTEFKCKNKKIIFKTLLYFKYSMKNPTSNRKKQFLYIKLEKHGLYKLTDIIMHSFDYVISRFNSKSFKVKRSEHAKFSKYMDKYIHEYKSKTITNFVCNLIPECTNKKQYEYTSFYRKGNEIYIPKSDYKNKI
jgi:hypothetical protein